GLKYYTLEAEFNAITANPLIADRSTAAFTGFTILMSPVPGLPTVPIYRMYYGIQFNANGTQTDMGLSLPDHESVGTVVSGRLGPGKQTRPTGWDVLPGTGSES